MELGLELYSSRLVGLIYQNDLSHYSARDHFAHITRGLPVQLGTEAAAPRRRECRKKGKEYT